MNSVILKPRRRRWHTRVSFELRYLWYSAISSIRHVALGAKLILKNETIWYYSYTTNTLLILTGLEYVKYISVDAGETAWLMINGTFHNCERF